MAKRRRQIPSSRASSRPSATLSLAACGPWLAARRVQLVQVFVIIAAALWVYAPALDGGLIWDDGWYITTNPLLHDWAGLWKFWFSPGSWTEYYPINETVIWIEYQLWGEHPLGYHLVSLGFHLAGSLLVWRLLARFGLRLAWLGGLLFAISPVQVQSVAWISEMKNTISLPLAVLAMIAWIDFEENRRTRDYRLALLFFVLSMLGKITMAPFPFVLALYAWWKRGRLDLGDLKRIAPFLVISIALVALTQVWSNLYAIQGHVQDVPLLIGDPLTRLMRAAVLWWFYLGSSLFPVNLIPIYPKWAIAATSPLAWLSALALVFLVGWCWVRRATWGRHVLLGLGFFGLNLLPFLGLNAISYMAETWIEIHLLYLPVIGVIGLAIAAVEDLGRKLPAPARFVPLGATAAVTVAFLVGARSFAGWFVGEETFWTRTLHRNPDAWMAYHDLGCYMIQEKRYPEAIALLRHGIEMLPAYDFGYYNLGIAMEKSGRADEAMALYRTAIRLNPMKPNAYLNLGEALRKQGKLDQAEQTFREGLAHAPDAVDLNVDLAGMLLEKGQVLDALKLYDQAIQLNPDFAQLQYDYGSALLKSGDMSDAEIHFAKAVELDPKLAVAHQSLGAILAQTGRLAEAIDEFQAALDINANLGPARENLARALAQSGRIPEAIEQYQKVVDLHPGDAQARQNLASLQQYELRNPGAGLPKP
jgi:tetratricopeptide (TPR) repeat protein